MLQASRFLSDIPLDQKHIPANFHIFLHLVQDVQQFRCFFWGGGAFPISCQGAKADKLSRRGEDRNFKTSYRITSHFGPDEESPHDHFSKQEEPPFINQVAPTRRPCTSVGKNAKSQLASSLIRRGLILLHVARTVLIKRELLEEKAANFTLLSWSHKADTE